MMQSTDSAAATSSPGAQSALKAYGFTLACVAAAAVARLALTSLGFELTPYLLLTLPVILGAWYGGFGPGMVAAVLAVVLMEVVFGRDRLAGWPLADHLVEVALFLAQASLISWLGHLNRRVTGSLLREQQRLEDRVAERTGELTAANAAMTREAAAREREHAQVIALNAKLEESNRELQDFASVASHDLQEPLRKIQAFGDRLAQRYSEPLQGPGQDYLARMQRAAGRMQGLINDLLTFSRVTSEARPFTPVNLTDVATQVVSDLEHRIQDVGGRVEVERLPVIDADPLQMWQLFQNLIGNGLKFAKPGVAPVVRVSAKWPVKTADGVEAVSIHVSDNGIGLDEKYLDRIFHVFQRLHGRDAYEGTGIGLAVCRKIATRHGGTVTAQSQPGQGATFLVTLPMRQVKGDGIDESGPRQADHDSARG